MFKFEESYYSQEFLFEERNTNLYDVIFKFYAAVIKIQHRQT